MVKQLIPIWVLFKRLGILVLAYLVCRLLFYGFNLMYFPDIDFKEVLTIFWGGLRFDLTAIVWLNVLLIILHIIPNPWFGNKIYQWVLKALFFVVNVPPLFLAFVDIAYYQFTTKRSTWDIFKLKEDATAQALPLFAQYWYLVLIGLLMLVVVWWLYQKTFKSIDSSKPNYLWQSIAAILVLGVSFLIARGGWQEKPIAPIVANNYTSPHNTTLVTNTPFVLLHSSQLEGIVRESYFEENELDNYLQVHRQIGLDSLMLDSLAVTGNPNVVIILLESFSKEYIGYYHPEDTSLVFTPFLDSLFQHSLVCTNAYANGRKSIEAIPSILASLPGLTQEPYALGMYASNQLKGLGTYLKDRGYQTSFFHGAYNGTFGFDSFSKALGFDKYYGKDEYGNDDDYDGSWGIYDEPFLQYTAKQFEQTAQPFASVIFTLSSHNPYKLPEEYDGKFKQGAIPMLETVMYTDYALQQFFKTAKQMDWYQNTLFIITADHIGPLNNKYQYNNRMGWYKVPLAFYHPNSKLIGTYEPIASHVDIMPTVLEYIGYQGAYSGYGHSIFDNDVKGQGHSVSRLFEIYQIIDSTYALQSDNVRAFALYNYIKDPRLKNNILTENKAEAKRLDKQLKATIQTFNDAIIDNELVND